MSLNMNNLNLTKEWAKEVKTWTLRDSYEAVAAVAVRLWPYDETPRDFDVVMDKFMDSMKGINGVYSIASVDLVSMCLNDLVEIIYQKLMDIKEFRQWNLTKIEYAHGVDVDNNNGEWFKRSDQKFVDLEAFKQNVYCALRMKLIEDYFLS